MLSGGPISGQAISATRQLPPPPVPTHPTGAGGVLEPVGAVSGAATFEREYAFVGDAVGLTWVHFFDAANIEHVWSKVALPDWPSYYGGFKDASIISWGEIQRALSDYRGQYEGATFTWMRSDTDRLMRTLLASHATRVLTGRSCILRTIDDAARRQGVPARTLARGIVREIEPTSPLEFKFTAQDYFSAKFTIGASDVQIPRRTIQRDDFPNCPTTAIGQPVPILYGVLSDSQGGATDAPAITGDPATGYFLEGPYPHAGFGALASGAAPPANLRVSAAPGGALSSDVPDATYGVIVTAVDGEGRESDATPYFTNQSNVGGRGTWPGHVPTAVVDGTQRIVATWDAAPGAAVYRCYLGYYYFGARWLQVIETTATSCAFTDNPSSATPVDPTNITPGASPPTWSQFWYYAVAAVRSDGSESARSTDVFGLSSPYRRPVRLQWLPVTNAASYRIYRRAANGTYDRMWTVDAPTTTFDDDLLDTGAVIILGPPVAQGVVPVTYVGETPDITGTPWSTFLVCGHAVSAILEWYAGGVQMDPSTAGVDWAVPGWPGFATYFPNTGRTQYRDINGRRYTLIYVRGPSAAAALAGTAPITLNLFGIEAWGDSRGPVVTSLALQYLHALQNWLIGDYQSGAWLPSPPMPDDPLLTQIDDASFSVLDALFTAQRGGYTGAFMLGGRAERISMRDTMTRFHLCGIDAGFNRRTQFFVTAVDRDPARVAQAIEFTQARHIHADALAITDDASQWFNVHPYDYRRDYRQAAPAEWTLSGEARADPLIADYGGEERVAQRVQLHMIRDARIAASIMATRLLLTAEPPRQAVFSVSLEGLDVEPGDIVLVTHLDGIGAQGWVKNPVRVFRHDYDPEAFRVRIEAYDANRIFGTQP
jgi:hypothetical protein